MRHPASATLQTSVIYELELSFNGLCNQGTAYADDAQYLQDFYEACRGGYGWFLFDPSQYSLANMSVAQVPATGATVPTLAPLTSERRKISGDIQRSRLANSSGHASS